MFQNRLKILKLAEKTNPIKNQQAFCN